MASVDDGWVERHEWLCLSLVIVAFSAAAAVHAYTQAMWRDEICTAFLTRPSGWKMIRALAADTNPPLQYLLAGWCARLFGEHELSFRLPSLVAFSSAAIAVYLFVRRRCRAIVALLSAALLLASPFAMYAWEARPYALMLAFTAWTLVAWQSACEGGSVWSRAALSLAIAGALLTHHYALFYIGLPLFIGESIRSWQNRRLDRAMIAAIITGLLALSITIPLAWISWQSNLQPANHSLAGHPPTVRDMFAYASFLPQPPAWTMLALFALLSAIIVVHVTTTDGARWTPAAITAPAYEIAAIASVLLVLPLVAAIGMLGHLNWYERYAIGLSLAIAILAGLLIPILGRAATSMSMIAAVVFFATLSTVWSAIEIAWRGQIHPPKMMEIAAADSFTPLPIVITNEGAYSIYAWYGPASLRSRLTFLFEPSEAKETGEYTLWNSREFSETAVERFETFRAANPRFLLCGHGWVYNRFRAAGWHFQGIDLHCDGLVLIEAPH